MAKWIFYVLVFVYMCYRAAYGARVVDTSISVDQIHYEDDGYLEEGTRKTVNCRAPSKNQRLEWVDPYDNVVKRIPSNRVYAQEHFISSPKGNRLPGLVLTFSSLAVSDTGLYQCKSGEQKKSVRVCVIKPSEFVESDDTPKEITVEAGRSITLACQAKGDPEPRLLWRRNDEELNEDVEHPKYKVNRRYKIEGYESLLTITDVQPEDAGQYDCLAVQESAMLDNCSTSDARNVTLHVNYKSTFVSTEEYAFGLNNEVVDITCKAKGWPQPTYRWFKDLGGGSLYDFDESKIRFSEKDNTATLSVTAGPTTYGNIYKCTATNSLGEAHKLFKLLKKEKPWKVDLIEPVEISNSTIKLKVSWEEVYFPIDGFSVQYIAASSVNGKMPVKAGWNKARQVEIEIEEENEDEEEEGEDDDDSDDVIITLEDLEPETEYFVRVKALNEVGESPWSDGINVSTNNENIVTSPEASEEESEKDAEHEAEIVEANNNSTMFYGVFFTGGIIVLAIVCMFAMRLV